MSLWVAINRFVSFNPVLPFKPHQEKGIVSVVHVSREQDVSVFDWLLPFISLLRKANIGHWRRNTVEDRPPKEQPCLAMCPGPARRWQ